MGFGAGGGAVRAGAVIVLVVVRVRTGGGAGLDVGPKTEPVGAVDTTGWEPPPQPTIANVSTISASAPRDFISGRP
jgi:hypothetical protein